MTTMDILTPGDWMDSYESRLIEYKMPISKLTIQSIVKILKDWLKTKCASDIFSEDMFNDVYLYIDGQLFGTMDKYHNLKIFAPSTHDYKTNTIRYPFGKEDLVIDIDLSLS